MSASAAEYYYGGANPFYRGHMELTTIEQLREKFNELHVAYKKSDLARELNAQLRRHAEKYTGTTAVALGIGKLGYQHADEDEPNSVWPSLLQLIQFIDVVTEVGQLKGRRLEMFPQDQVGVHSEVEKDFLAELSIKLLETTDRNPAGPAKEKIGYFPEGFVYAPCTPVDVLEELFGDRDVALYIGDRTIWAVHDGVDYIQNSTQRRFVNNYNGWSFGYSSGVHVDEAFQELYLLWPIEGESDGEGGGHLGAGPVGTTNRGL